MPAARYWRLVGLQTYAGGDLDLSGVHLYGTAGRLDVAGAFSSTVPPSEGSVAALQDDNVETTCRFAGSAVRSGGFALTWDFGAGNTADAIGVRLGAADKVAKFLAECDLQYSNNGTQWEPLTRFARYEYPGAFSYTAAPAAGDIYFSKVVSLLNFDGANGSTLFNDATGKIWTPSGNARIDSTLGYNVGLFDGNGAAIITPNNSDFHMGSADFTIEGVAKLAAVVGQQTLWEKRSTGFAAGDMVVFVVDGQIWVYAYEVDPSGNAILTSGTGTIVPGVEFHWAWTRSGTAMRLFLNGTLKSTKTTTATIAPISTPVAIGRDAPAGGRFWLNGYVRAARVTKGVARYTANFTPPSAPFPDATTGTVFIDPKLDTNTSQRLSTAASAAVPELTVVVTPGAETAADIEFGGNCRIYGTVSRRADPANAPLRRRVRLHRSKDGMLVRETWSQTDGSYAFNGITEHYEYDVIAYDHEHNFRAVIADGITPEIIP